MDARGRRGFSRDARHPPGAPPGSLPPPPPADPQARREALADAGDRMWDAFARQDLDEMKRWLDDEAVLIGEERIEGSDGITAFLRRYLEGVQVQGWAHTQRSLRLEGEVGVVS